MKTLRSGYTSIPGSNEIPRGSVPEKPKRIAVLGDSVAIPFDVFDRVALDLEPEEFAVYLHLARLAWATGVDCCRVSRSELERRLRMSQLRLGKALAGLVEKKHVALVDRNRDGTLYRVPLPSSAPPERARPLPQPPAKSRGAPEKSTVASIGDLARRVLEQRKMRAPDEVLEELLGLVEDGHALDDIAAAIDRFLVDAPKTAPISELGRYLTR